MVSEVSPPLNDVVGGDLLFGLYFLFETVFPVARIIYRLKESGDRDIRRFVPESIYPMSKTLFW